MKSPYYWISKYREYTFASTCKFDFFRKRSTLYSIVENAFDRSLYGWNGNIEIIERRIYQALIYRNKVIHNYPYDYSEKLRWDSLLFDADDCFEALLKYYKDEATKQGIKFNKFKRMIRKLSNSDKEYNSILTAAGIN